MSSDQPDRSEPASSSATASRRGPLQYLVEPPVLFTAIGLLVLAVVWGTTLNLTARERASSERAATSLTSDVADTYEAQIVRALREIDQTLKLVRYALNEDGAEDALLDLGDKGLLPPSLLFTVAVFDSRGTMVAANNDVTAEEMAVPDLLRQARQSDAMVIGLPRRDADNGEWHLDFARALQGTLAGGNGIVTVSVHAGYFVSGYEPAVMGAAGVLGLVGTDDGIFRVLRTGDALSAGRGINQAELLPPRAAEDAPAEVVTNAWDDTRRYMIVRQLFEFPLAIVVGLSEQEQLATVSELHDTYLWRAAGISALLLAIVALLGVLSWRLQQARTRVMEERIEHAQRIEYLAFHDNLTDLPNRAYFSRLLTQGIQRARRYHRGLALLFLDLDRFKAINDSLGHDAGDELLQEIGRRLVASVRESDIVARLGGDEFVVLLPEVDSRDQVTPVAEKILAAVAKPFTLAGQEFRITVSIGITSYPGDGADEQTLMKNADVAMYHAKEQGKNNYQFYSQTLRSDSLERLALEAGLRNALERGEFRVLYQARRSFSNGAVTGTEALLYWNHPELGLIQPNRFMPLAEETGLIVPIGRWLLRSACRQNVAWQAEGFPPLSIAVNLSARQFIDESLLRDIEVALDESGMEAKLLEVEIGENMLLRDLKLTKRVLNALKQMGVSVAIDHFGTGYSSLSTLKEMPFDTIKIDRSFFRDDAGSIEGQGLTQAIIAVGRKLSLSVIAEGVETKGQHEFLRSQLCSEFQGYYGKDPMPADQLAKLLRRQLSDAASQRPTE